MSDDTGKPGTMTRLLATVCTRCPFCILKRKWPGSVYGRFMKYVERGCPFCRAAGRLHALESNKP